MSKVNPVYQIKPIGWCHQSNWSEVNAEVFMFLSGTPDTHETRILYHAKELKEENAELKENRNRLVVAIHSLASNFENILGVLADDNEALTKAKGDIAHAMKVAANNRG